ncbi:MAG TPA: hypothetical protein VL424_21670, partial [Pararobbsia sp.]|nr:hypothetical protein [Pararobbsia sp.]
MTPLNTIEPLRVRPPFRWFRWVIALALVLVLHFVAGTWVIRATRIADSAANDTHAPVQVALLKPQAVTDVARPRSPGADAVARATGQPTPLSAQSSSSRKGTEPTRQDALQASLNAHTSAPPPPQGTHAKASQAKPALAAPRPSSKPARKPNTSTEVRPRDERSTEHAQPAEASTSMAASAAHASALASNADAASAASAPLNDSSPSASAVTSNAS